MTAISTTGGVAPLQILVPQFLCFALNDTQNNAGIPVGPDLGKLARDLKKRNMQLGQKVNELTLKLDASTQQNLQQQRLIAALNANLMREEQELEKIKSSLNISGDGGDTNIVEKIQRINDAGNACNASLSKTQEELTEIADNFNQTQDKLNNTEHKLNKTAVQLDFTNNIVDALAPNRSLLLTEAVAMGNTYLIIPLIRLGTPVTAPDQFGYVALDWATLDGDSEVAKLLVENGANVNAKLPTYNDFPLHVAARAGYTDLLRVLLDAQADKDAANVDGNTALHEAAYYGQENEVKILLDAGVAVDAKNSEGYTPLLFAAEAGHLPVVKLLVNKGANEKVRNQEGRTPQEEAQMRGKQNVETWLDKRM